MPAGLPRLLAVITITIGLMMSVLSNSMTNLALPYIAQDLNITAESSIWIVNASQIALMVCLLPVAALADIVGYRHVYRIGLAVFCVASLGCALAPRCSPSPPGRSCSPSTCRWEWSRSCWPKSTSRTPRTPAVRSMCSPR
jgi:MFS family permease